MKRTYWKGCLRDFVRSKSRFFAIVAIVALGAGFFGGIKATSVDMKRTADAYYKECNLYDFRLVSTLGITEGDAAAIAAMEGVAEVTPSYQVDAVIHKGDSGEGELSSNTVVRFHSIPDGGASINKLILTEGRLPEGADECVIVAKSSLGSAFQIGETIRFDRQEDPDGADSFACEELTVVGLVTTPLYMSLDTTNTTKGSGVINTYAFLPAGGFELDAYTELYLTLAGSKELFCFDDPYAALTAEWEQKLEEVGVERCALRYAEVTAEADEKLADGWREYNEQKAEAEQELADGKQELADGWAELADGEQKLADGKQELEDARQELLDGEKELADKQKEFDDGIAEAAEQLADAERELADNEKTLADGWEQLGSARSQLEAAEEEYRQSAAALESQKQAAYQQIEAGVAAAIAQIEQSPLPQEQKLPLIEAAKAEGEARKQAVDAQLAPFEAELSSGRAALDSSWNSYNAKRAEAIAGSEALEEGKRALADAKKEFETEKADGEGQLADARQELADGWAELADGEAELADSERELADARRELTDGQREYNEQKAEAEQKLADGYAELLDAEKELAELEYPEWYVLDREMNAGYVGFSQDTDRIDAVAAVFPIFFFLVAALVCLTSMTRMIEEERTQIGVLKALGYGKAAILAKYLFYAAATSLIGSVVGLLIGFQVFPRVIWAAYGIMYTTPPIQTYFNWTYAILATLVFLLCTVGATFAACWNELVSVPASLIRPKPPKSGKRIFLERIPFLWRRFSFTWKLTSRNILRYKKRFFMTVIGVAGCTALMLTGFGLKDSISGIVPNQFEKLFHYDMQLTLSDELDPAAPTAEQQSLLDSLDSDGRITNHVLLHQENATALSAGSDVRMDVYVVVPEDSEKITDFITFRTRQGKKAVPFPEEGALLSEKLATELGLSIGGSLILEDPDGRQVSVPVAGIIENYVQHYVYFSPRQYAALYGEDCRYQGVFAAISEEGEAFESRLSADLLRNDAVLGVAYTTSIVETFTEMFDRLDLVVLVLIVSASLLAFVVLYNLTNININERIREIATIKVLGFYDREVDGYVYRENVVLTLIGILAGFAGGVFLHQYVMRVAEVNMVMFGREILPLSYLWAGLLTLVFAGIVNFVMHFRLKHISMVESLKSIE